MSWRELYRALSPIIEVRTYLRRYQGGGPRPYEDRHGIVDQNTGDLIPLYEFNEQNYSDRLRELGFTAHQIAVVAEGLNNDDGSN